MIQSYSSSYTTKKSMNSKHSTLASRLNHTWWQKLLAYKTKTHPDQVRQMPDISTAVSVLWGQVKSQRASHTVVVHTWKAKQADLCVLGQSGQHEETLPQTQKRSQRTSEEVVPWVNPEKAPQALLRSLGEDLSSHTQHPSKQLGIIMHAKNSVLERTGKQESLLGLLTTNLEKTFIIQSSN